MMRHFVHHNKKVRTVCSYFFIPYQGFGYFISARLACRTRDTRLTFHYANKFARFTITAVVNRVCLRTSVGSLNYSIYAMYVVCFFPTICCFASPHYYICFCPKFNAYLLNFINSYIASITF